MARWATDTAAQYAKIREQFGRPIGQFQAIKHKCAEMIADTERATAAVWDAARALDEAREADQNNWDTTGSKVEFAAAVAATLAPAAAQRCTQDCIQVHGGIGFTWEHDTNVYYRRALMLAACFGRSSEYPQRVVDTATDTGLRAVDIDLDPDTEKLRDEIRAEVTALKAMERDARKVAIAEGGWVLPYLPKPWGRAASPVEQIIIAQEFTTGRVKRPQVGIAAWIIPSIVAFGTEEQKQRFLPPTFRGEMIWCQLFSEPGAGSDLAGLSHQGDPGRRRLAHQRPEDLDHGRAVLAVGRATGPDRPKRPKTQWHHLLPAGHEERRRHRQAAARAHRRRVLQHRLHRRRVRARRVRARRSQPGLGGQPQHPDGGAGIDRQQRQRISWRPSPSSSSSFATGSSTRSRSTAPAS